MDIQFGSYRLKRAERLLLGPEGPVELSARSFDILVTLLARPDQVVSKSELFDVVWPQMLAQGLPHRMGTGLWNRHEDIAVEMGNDHAGSVNATGT